MSQRNPLNDRYTTDSHTGSTRKSAASAKPKAKAAATVHIQSTEKTPQEKKAARKEQRRKERAKQREVEAKYYNPNTPRYRKLRRAWWILLLSGCGCMVLALFLRNAEPAWLTYVLIGVTYALIIIAFWLDITKTQKERRRFQAEMMALEEATGKQNKQNARRQATAEREAAKKKALSGEVEETPAPATPKKQGFFSRFGKKTATADVTASDEVVAESK